MLLITGFQNGMRASWWMLRSCTLWLPRSSVHHHNQVSRLDLGSSCLPLMHCRILPSNRVRLCGAKKPCRAKYPRSPRLPFDFPSKVAHRSHRDPLKGEVVAPHQPKGKDGQSLVSSGRPHAFPFRHNRPDAVAQLCMLRLSYTKNPTATSASLLRVILHVVVIFFHLTYTLGPEAPPHVLPRLNIVQLDVVKCISSNVYKPELRPHVS